MSPLSDMCMYCEYFLPVCSLPFTFLTIHFEILNLDEVEFIRFFIYSSFLLCPKKALPMPRWCSFLLEHSEFWFSHLVLQCRFERPSSVTWITAVASCLLTSISALPPVPSQPGAIVTLWKHNSDRFIPLIRNSANSPSHSQEKPDSSERPASPRVISPLAAFLILGTAPLLAHSAAVSLASLLSTQREHTRYTHAFPCAVSSASNTLSRHTYEKYPHLLQVFVQLSPSHWGWPWPLRLKLDLLPIFAFPIFLILLYFSIAFSTSYIQYAVLIRLVYYLLSDSLCHRISSLRAVILVYSILFADVHMPIKQCIRQ